MSNLMAFYCEADEDYHDALRDPGTGMCPACTAPPERMADTGLVHGPARPTVADVAALYPSYAARGAFLVPLLRIARDA
jgi:hypothetical protein